MQARGYLHGRSSFDLIFVFAVLLPTASCLAAFAFEKFSLEMDRYHRL